jgi:signal transduction histidine kinase
VINASGVRVNVVTDRVCVFGEQVRLHRMFDNLLSNALKFSPHGGEVDVELTRDEDRVLLRVSDHGIGIPPEDLPHVFDRLFRAENANNSQLPGTGLGLSIAAAIVEGHGGSIGATSEESVGTVVTVDLPAHDCDEPLAD